MRNRARNNCNRSRNRLRNNKNCHSTKRNLNHRIRRRRQKEFYDEP